MVLGAATIAATGAPALASTKDASPASPLPFGQQLPSSEVPWGDVGPGWSLAILSPAGSGRPILYVVDPAGGRYRVPAMPTLPYDMNIADWSGDKERVLIASDLGGGASLTSDVNLVTGATMHQFTSTGSYSYTLPDGLALLDLVPNLGSGTQKLVRTSLDGSAEFTFPTAFPGKWSPSPRSLPTFNGTYVETPDGTEIVMGANLGMSLVSNGGSVIRQLVTPGLGSCSPVEWWQPWVVLASCNGPTGAEQYWLVPISGTKPMLFGPVGGTFYLWKVDGAVYSETALGQKVEGCVSIVRFAHGAWSRATVPGDTSGYAMIVGAFGDQLELEWGNTACGQDTTGVGESLLIWSSPSTHKSTVVLGGPATGGLVTSTLPYPGGW